MTQLYRIDTSNPTTADESRVTAIVDEWANQQASFRIKEHYEDSWGQQETQDFVDYGPRAQQNLHVAVYRKNGVNYVWRGMIVSTDVRMRIRKAIESDAEGTVLLYKSGGHRLNKGLYFPIRLSNNRYAFVLGSTRPINQWIHDPTIERPASEGLDTLFDLWASEHIQDYKFLNSSGATYNTSFRQRAQYVFCMTEFINDEKWHELYDLLFGNEPEVLHRSAFCVCKDGEVERWLQRGLDIHPKI